MDSQENRSIGAEPGTYAEVLWQRARRAYVAGAEFGRGVLLRRLDGGYMPGKSDAAAPGISVSGLAVTYQARPAIEDVTVEFPPRSLTAIVGPNGAGKSTLLKAIAGILRPSAGRVDHGSAGPREIAYMPQSDEVDRSFPISVGEFVALGSWRAYGAFMPVAESLGGDVLRALDAVGLAAAHDRPIAALSVGQFRRALFARLMLQQARALLLDEPFSAIDASTTADLLRLVERWHAEGRTVVAVLHDLGQVRAHFPHAVLLARRCIAAGETAAVLTPENLARAGFGDGGTP
jgi:zinc/manganese transport system ATP-binding protein